MAKKATTNGKSLVIVESPAKARTIGKYLGPSYTVEASIGHVRDLPKGKRELPEQYKGKEWADLAVNVDEDFAPVYIVPADKKQQVTKLKKLLKECTDLYLATDEDREGEAISWHLCELLNPKVPVHRLVFHEITQQAIREALANPRTIDDGLVRAQETRRILDRLYGYTVSPLLWKKVGRGLSAGRVQSVAVRLIVERERERIAFVSASYWDLLAQFLSSGERPFEANLQSVEGKRLPTGKDFDANTGKLKDSRTEYLLLNEPQARELAEQLKQVEFRVTKLEEKPFQTSPAAPFTTSTMQQEANRKLGFTARHTMRVAQYLYENGYITYMRTDSTNLAAEAVTAARDLVSSQYGTDYLPDAPRVYKSKVKNAQEAHEAIRPAGHPFALPEALQGELNRDQFRLFELIWKRTIASQMVNARGRSIVVTIEGGGAVFQVRGKTIEFPGFLRAYVEGSDDPDAQLADKEVILPPLAEGELIQCRDMLPQGHDTKPPARYSEAALTRELERRGIGRPSTYATIIDTILNRKYVFKRGNALIPTWVAFSVCRLLEDHLPSLINYEFTAQMEDFLDAVSRGEAEHLKYLRDFYFGNEQPGLKRKLEDKLEEIDARLMSRFELGEPEQGGKVYIRVGRWGPFLEQGEDREDPDYRTANIPADLAPDEMTLPRALELLENAKHGDEPLGVCPETGREVYLKAGRFGPYVQLGTNEDGGEKPKNASLLKGMEPADVNLEVALQLLSLPRTLGDHPESNEPIMAYNGRYGPYVKCGDETRSLPNDMSPLDVSKEQALELLAQPKTRGRGRAAPKEPIKVFDPSPVTGEPIKLLEGRYGPYVTDGETNASIPKDVPLEELELKTALDLLAARAAKAGTKKKKAKKKATKKKTTKKAAKKTTKKAAKKTTAKKAAKKKASSSEPAKKPSGTKSTSPESS